MYINIFFPGMSSKALDGFARCGHDKVEEGIVRAAAGGTRSATAGSGGKSVAERMSEAEMKDAGGCRSGTAAARLRRGHDSTQRLMACG
jgi:hypothetical protein